MTIVIVGAGYRRARSQISGGNPERPRLVMLEPDRSGVSSRLAGASEHPTIRAVPHRSVLIITVSQALLPGVPVLDERSNASEVRLSMGRSIDVVITTHQGWELTNRCLKHLQEQTVAHTVIVSDSASTDGTAGQHPRALPGRRAARARQ